MQIRSRFIFFSFKFPDNKKGEKSQPLEALIYFITRQNGENPFR
jgi:hypothetical protein